MTTEYAPSVPNDAELITAARSGAYDAYDELYRRHEQAARAAARCLTSSTAEAEALVIRAFTLVLQSMRAGRGPEIAFRPYLLGAVRLAGAEDAALDGDAEAPDAAALVDINAMVLAPSDDDDASPDPAAVAFANLPERWQVALWHLEVEGRPGSEVAPLLGLEATAVAALAYRAHEGFRQAYLQAARLHDLPPPECADCRPKLGAYERDGLSARERSKVEEHLDGCDGCRALLADLDGASGRLRAVLVPLVVGVAGTTYVTALRGGRGLVGVFRRAGRGPRLAAGLAAAAAVLAFAVIGASALTRASVPREEQADPAPDPSVVGTDTTRADRPSRSVATTVESRRTTTGTSVASALPVPIPALPLAPAGPRSTVAPIPIRPRPPVTAPRPTQPVPTTVRTVPLPVPSTTSSTSTTTAPATSSTVETGLPPLAGPAVSVTAGGPFVAGHFGYVDVSVINVGGGVGGGPGTRRAVAGAGPVTDTVVSMELPAGIGFSSVDGPGWTCSVDAGTLTCALPELPAGTTSRARIELTLDASLNGLLDLTPSIRAAGREAREGPTLGVSVAPGGDLAYLRVLRGGVTAIGNTSMTCVDPGVECAAAQQGSAAGEANLRRSHAMGMVGAAAGVLNRSSATLALPAGATVEKALLVWSGDLAAGDGGGPAPGDPASVDFDGPTGTTAVDADVLRTAADDPAVYLATADVTALVTSAGTYSVSGVQAGTGVGQFAGWSIVVAYRDAAAPPALVALVDRWSTLGSTPTVASLDGLAPIAGDRSVGIVWAAQEGDLTLVDEQVQVNGVTVADSQGQPGDVFNSSIDGDRSPAYVNNFGIDVDRVTATVPGAATTVSLSAVSSGDRARLGPVGFVVTV